MSPKEQILALIPKLKAEDIPAIRKSLDCIASDQHSKVPVELNADDWLLPGIVSYLSWKGLLSGSKGASLLMKRKGFAQYQQKLPDALEYLDDLLAKYELGTRHRTQMAIIATYTLGGLLEHWKVFSVGAMLINIDKIPEAVERGFPGYIQAGLFGFVLKTSVDAFDGIDERGKSDVSAIS